MRTILALLLCGTALLAADPPRRAPGFALLDGKMKLHDLYDHRGKTVIVEFMQTTCPHCASFTAVLKKAQQKYGDKLAILAIALPPDNGNTVAQYIAGHKVTYPVLIDMGQVAYSYVMKPSLDFPHIVIVDPQGMIYNTFTYGPMTRDIFEGNGLFSELDKVMAASGRAAPAPKGTPPPKGAVKK